MDGARPVSYLGVLHWLVWSDFESWGLGWTSAGSLSSGMIRETRPSGPYGIGLRVLALAATHGLWYGRFSHWYSLPYFLVLSFGVFRRFGILSRAIDHRLFHLVWPPL